MRDAVALQYFRQVISFNLPMMMLRRLVRNISWVGRYFSMGKGTHNIHGILILVTSFFQTTVIIRFMITLSYLNNIKERDSVFRIKLCIVYF